MVEENKEIEHYSENNRDYSPVILFCSIITAVIVISLLVNKRKKIYDLLVTNSKKINIIKM